jgi:hypothetical protein
VAPASTVPDVPAAVDPLSTDKDRLPDWTIVAFAVGVFGFFATIAGTIIGQRLRKDD